MEYAQFDPTGFALLWEKVIKQYIGQTTNEERVKELMTQFSTKLDGYEVILRKQKYLAGDVRTFHSKHVPKETVDLMNYLCRRSHSQIYSMYRLVTLSLSSSN